MNNKISELINTDRDAQIALQNIISNLPGHVYWKNKDGVYLGCNEKQVKSLGLENINQMIGKTDFELPWKREDAEKFRENDLHIMETGCVEIFEESALIDGHPGTVLSHKTPLRNEKGDVIGILGISLDISERKEMEEQLKIAKEKAAEMAKIVKLDFIHNMEHDIRTPAGGVWALLDCMVREEQDPKKRERLTVMRDSAKELMDLCDEVVAFDKIERGTLRLTSKKLNIKNIIDEIVALNGAAALNKKLALSSTISNEMPLILKSDEHRLKRILINLVGNAIKFTHEGHVNLAVSMLKEDDKTALLEFKINDTGIGIPKDQQNYIYEKFTRLSPSNKGHYKGTGLGLQVVKKFVEELEGEIEVQSEIGQGTTFYVTLRFEKPLNENIRD